MRPKLLTVPKFAEEVSVGQTTVWRLIKEGQIESVKIGDLRRIPSEEVDRYIERLRQKQSAAVA